MKKFIVVIVLCLAGVFVILSFSELESISQIVQHANPWYLAVAILIQIVYFVIVGLVFKSLYRLLGLDESLQRLTVIAAASSFVGVVTPSAGIGGLAIFISDGQKRGNSPGKIMVANALYLLLDEAAFLCVLTIGITLLIQHNRLNAQEIAASLILLGLACAWAFALYLGYRSSTALGNLLAKLASWINRALRPFIHRDYLSEDRAHTFAAEIGEGLHSLPKKPLSLLPPFLLLLVNKAMLIGILATAFLSFNLHVTIDKAIAGFSIAYLFLIVSPTPSGVGVVESVMPIVLHSLRTTLAHALVITLAYRAVTFWLPLAIGALAFRFLQIPALKSK